MAYEKGKPSKKKVGLITKTKKKTYGKNDKPYIGLPVTTLNDEMLYIASGKTHNFTGDGLVMKISRGEKFDIVTVMFGIGVKYRDVVVTHTRARRQILTLKRGQWARFGGMARLYQEKTKPKEGYKSVLYKKWYLFAYFLQGYYTPKMFDIRKRQEDIDNGEEIDYIDPLDKDKETQVDMVVQDIFNGEGKGVVDYTQEMKDDFIDKVYIEVNRKRGKNENDDWIKRV